jgi:hypothetical protein
MPTAPAGEPLRLMGIDHHTPPRRRRPRAAPTRVC